MDLVGQDLGQYHITETIGSGGMASVFKAYQPALDRFVAIKVLSPQIAQVEGFGERFFREARAVAQLSHPNILPIYDVGIENGISYFVMKYIPGKTLGDIMAEPISLAKVGLFVGQMAAALQHAHDKGILHRDIKPANMLLEGDDWLFLADFGLAKIVEGEESLTATGMSMGTPSFASPEQVEGDPVDRRTDIYSLGIVMYEMVTGMLPYHGATPMSIMFKHVHEPLPLPTRINPGIPAGIERIILKATAKNREERYNKAEEMAADIKEFLDTGSVSGAAPPPVLLPQVEAKSPPPASRHAEATIVERGATIARKNWIAIGAAAVIALIILVGIGIVMARQLGQSNDSLAAQYEREFNDAVASPRRLGALAHLFELGDFDDRGRVLFNKLLPEQKIELFANVPPAQSREVRPVVEGTYSHLEDTDGNNSLLESMQNALNQTGEAENKSLASEIGKWLEARRAAANENFSDAEVAYGVAIGLNDQNPATYFERGQIQARLDKYPNALADFEAALNLSEDWQDRVSQAVQQNPELHLATWEEKGKYQAIVALVPKPDDTPTPTPLPTITNTPVPRSQDALPTATSTVTPEPVDTPAPVPSAATPAPPPPIAAGGGPPPPGDGPYQLVYTKSDGGEHSLFTADTNGENEQFLLIRAAGPTWSPDGKAIYFYGEPGVDKQIREGVTYVIESKANEKGISSGIVRLNAEPLPVTVDDVVVFQGGTWNEGSARWASAAPKGEVVAYDARPGGDYRIYMINGVNGDAFPFEIAGEQADWSPDGEQIVYRSGRDGKTGIWISNWNDTAHANVTNNGSDSFPAWSPDGQTIAFTRDEGGNVDIYTINANGTELKRLTSAPGPDTLPVYTPGGEIVFRTARTGAWGIWKMAGDGTGQAEIIPNAGVASDWAYSKMDVKR